MMRRLLNLLPRRLRTRFGAFGKEDGTASMEFVLVFPAFILLFGAGFELGLLSVRQTMLESATSRAVRGLQLSTGTPPTLAELKTQVCDLAFVLPDCSEAISIELIPVSTDTWQLPSGFAPCVDRDEDVDPVTIYTPGMSNEMMFVRVCVVFEPFFPSTGLGKHLPRVNESDYALVASSMFVNEP